MLFLIEDSYLIDPSPAACRLRCLREKKSIWIRSARAVFQVYWIISFSLSVSSMVKGLPCVLTLNNSHVATTALPTVGSCVIQQEIRCDSPRSDGLREYTVNHTQCSYVRGQEVVIDADDLPSVLTLFRFDCFFQTPQ